MNSVMPPLAWDPHGQAFAFVSVSLHLAKHLDHRHLSVCLDECSSQKQSRSQKIAFL